MSSAVPFAFLVHPRARIAEDLARVWRPLGRVPERLIDSAVRKLPLPSYAMARVHLDSAPVGHVVLVPFGARHLLSEPHEGRARVGRAIDHAARLGAGVVGLGALTATVTAGGATLRGRTDIGVTNGNAYTAAIVEDQLMALLADLPDRRVAVVGATGSRRAPRWSGCSRSRARSTRCSSSPAALPKLDALAAEVGRRVPTTDVDGHARRARLRRGGAADGVGRRAARGRAPGAGRARAGRDAAPQHLAGPRGGPPGRHRGRRRGRPGARHAPARRRHRAAARAGVRVLRGDVPARARGARRALLDGRPDPRPRRAHPRPGGPVRAPRVRGRRTGELRPAARRVPGEAGRPARRRLRDAARVRRDRPAAARRAAPGRGRDRRDQRGHGAQLPRVHRRGRRGAAADRADADPADRGDAAGPGAARAGHRDVDVVARTVSFTGGET